METSSEILTQAEEGAEATNHTGVQHKVSRSIDVAIPYTQEVLHTEQ